MISGGGSGNRNAQIRKIAFPEDVVGKGCRGLGAQTTSSEHQHKRL